MKETLDEASEKYANGWDEIHPELYWEDISPYAVSKIDFIEGAKWQTERMYNEIEIEIAFYEGMNGDLSFSEWFENFKKK
jgi:hypothetical protein